ncbi:RIP metalloprotease RseP [Tropicimonas sp. IMCC34043]|uniref:RIP metalloprotease RseP n=1 Tax=Tropicimonas sp. IMCC34043 TaxID=2248760 RepID=UPI000E231590|nr:RIP metalloprotease RseP [Tropicimonas sp. IMCC34043]
MDMTSLIPQFGGALWTLAAFVIALSVIVFVHEYGHYIVGRWSGIKAEVFSIGFGPVLMSRVDRHGTRWQVAVLPFGGYVKFLGDASAVSDKAGDEIEGMDAATLRQTMHGAPLWARAATVAAGPVFNFILSILIFAAVIMAQGVPTSPVEVGVLKPMPNVSQGLQPGDRILSVGGHEAVDYAGFFEVVNALPVTPTTEFVVERGGSRLQVEAPYPFPPIVDALQPGSAAMDAGIEVGDVVTAIDGTPVIAFRQVQDIVGGSDGRPMKVQIWRDGETLDFVLVPRRADLPTSNGGFETRWLIGMTGGMMFTAATATPGPLEALRLGGDQIVYIVTSSLSGLWHMVTGAISTCNLSGPIGIAETSGAAASQGADNFIWFIAVLSTAVGMLNLFPIPVLDGGHLVFHAFEALTGRPPSDRALRVLMGIGLSLMLGLMVFAVTNDLFCP